jgi:hypothetical protein
MPIRSLLAATAVTFTITARLPPIVIPAQSDAVTVQVSLSADREQLLAAAADLTSDVVLDLDKIETERPPGVYFEVFVHSDAEARGRSVGNLALYGTGIRSESDGVFQPAHARLVITEGLRIALRKSSTILITFVAQGAGGTATTARTLSAVTIQEPSIAIAPKLRE